MSSFSTQLEGKHALVTGGTKGIGRAIVELLLAQGANVSYCSRSATDNDFAAFLDESKPSGTASGTSVDISSPSSIETWVEKAARKFGRVDVVVANAASFSTEATAESWRTSFEADVLGLVSLINASTPHLEKTSGSIVVVSSVAGFETRFDVAGSPYTTFKRAQATLAKDYARKLGPLGIRINSVIPGPIEAPGKVLPDGSREPSRIQTLKETNPEYAQGILDAVSLRRFGTAEEVANVVVFLASPLAGYVCGANVLVDGAMSTFL
ncbi:short chain dehydrogenase family protein [Metarhizium robertsii]|uniref:Hydroxynaphthalene reductase-like protein Arp2 n=1 Tax=Metarhizium robertsii TaxID=568076 RepID=A0A0A1V4Q2_9HYPO|nr:short chain dehydrogenase family protein [Metarhizium robertsii]